MTGLSASQVTELRESHHVYLMPSGRLSVTGCKQYIVALFCKINLTPQLYVVTEANVDRVAVALCAVVGTN